MKLIRILAVLLLVATSRFAGAVDYFSLMDGDWFMANLWGRNSTTVSCGCNPDADGACAIIIPANAVVYIRHNVTTTCDLTIGSNATIIVQNGGTLTLAGNAGVGGTGDFIVETGGTVNVGGNFSLSGNGDVNLNGTINVNGNVSFGGSSSLCGSGNLNVGGTVTGGAPCVSITLPISLSFFNAYSVGKIVMTEWTTLSEQNNLYFTVERSSDGINYSSIGQVTGSMNSNQPISYNLKDESPLDGVSYYRLKQTDIDNNQKVFQPVVVIRNEVYLTPNLIQIQDDVSLFLNGFENKSVKVEIVEISGKVVQTIFQVVQTANEKITFNLNQSISSGLYLVYVYTADKKETLKLVVH